MGVEWVGQIAHTNLGMSADRTLANRRQSPYLQSMIVTLSPAKSLDFAPIDHAEAAALPQCGTPRLAERSELLVKALANMPRKRLAEIMPVSDALVRLNAKRYAQFYDQPEKPAIQAFSGDVYIGFEAKSLPAEALNFAQGHVRILSGLYGLLRPFDAIRPHRLEMGTKWAPRYKRLTDFWGSRIAELLRDDAAEAGAPFVLNLASQEYWASVAPYAQKLGIPVVNVDFRQDSPDGPKFGSFAAKRARGMMARFVCEHRLETVEQVKAFDTDGYRFVGEDGDTLRFVRS